MKTKSDSKARWKFNQTENFCICPKCGEKIPHVRGVQCRTNTCPNCGISMYREGSYHHRQWLRMHKDSNKQ